MERKFRDFKSAISVGLIRGNQSERGTQIVCEIHVDAVLVHRIDFSQFTGYDGQ